MGEAVVAREDDQIKRLLQIHDFYAPMSEPFLLKAGLKQGMSVLELGCGPGAMTEWLLSQVGPSGQVTAIDIESRYVELARTRNLQAHNCDIVELDIMKLAELSQRYDMVYCRMLLHHLPDTDEALALLIKSLKPGGVLVCEEPPAIEGVQTAPQSAAIAKLVDVVSEYLDQLNMNFRIAYTMDQTLSKMGCQVIATGISQPDLEKEDAMPHIMALKTVGSELAASGVISQADFDALYAQIAEDFEQSIERVSLFKLHQVAARC